MSGLKRDGTAEPVSRDQILRHEGTFRKELRFEMSDSNGDLRSWNRTSQKYRGK